MITLLTCEPLRPPRHQRLLINAVREEIPSETPDLAPELKETLTDVVQVDPSVKKLNIGIYIVTLLLLAALVFAVIKFIKYLIKR